MKSYVFNIPASLGKVIRTPVRNKFDTLEILIRCVKYMLVSDTLPRDGGVGKMVLSVERGSRLFFFTEDKFFSISFPFTVKEEKLKFEFGSTYSFRVDHHITSELLSVFQVFNGSRRSDLYRILEAVADVEVALEGFSDLLWHLLTYEDGYVRYDKDADNENGDIHPLYHYDFFYSSRAACKVGLRSALKEEQMMDLFSTSTACHYFESR